MDMSFPLQLFKGYLKLFPKAKSPYNSSMICPRYMYMYVYNCYIGVAPTYVYILDINGILNFIFPITVCGMCV